MLKKGRKAPNLQRTGTKRATIKFTLWEIAEIAGTTYAAILKASTRKAFNRKDLQSIIEYIIRTRKKKKLPELG